MNKITENPKAQSQAKDQPEAGHRGALLKKERENRGIAIETVHEATKIPLDSLRAIEEDYKIRTMSEFYYNSFLKIYAKYLGIDISHVADQHKEPFRPKPAPQDVQINFDILDTINKRLTKERKRQIMVVLLVLVGLWLMVKFFGFIAHRIQDSSPAKRAQTTQPKSEVASQINAGDEVAQAPGKGMTSPQETVVPADVPASSSFDPASGKSVVLTVRAKKESWLRVKVDGNIVFQSALNAGDVETWDADENIEITGRNISELEFELNGKMIGSLGRASRRAKALVVTKDGLSVSK